MNPFCDNVLTFINKIHQKYFWVKPVRKKCPYSELFWPVFYRIWTEYGEILSQTRENADQNNSETDIFHAV